MELGLQELLDSCDVLIFPRNRTGKHMHTALSNSSNILLVLHISDCITFITLVNIKFAHEVMDLSPISMPLVENRTN